MNGCVPFLIFNFSFLIPMEILCSDIEKEYQGRSGPVLALDGVNLKVSALPHWPEDADESGF